MTARTGKNPARARARKVERAVVAPLPGGEITAEITLADGTVIALDGSPDELRAVAQQLAEALAAVTHERDEAREQLSDVAAVVQEAEGLPVAPPATLADTATLPARVRTIMRDRDEARRLYAEARAAFGALDTRLKEVVAERAEAIEAATAAVRVAEAAVHERDRERRSARRHRRACDAVRAALDAADDDASGVESSP